MNAIQNFAFEEHLVRVVDMDGEPWFVGKDVCAVLDIRNHNDALGRLDEDERAEVGIADPSGTKTATAISEPGVYRLTFTSRKPEAERFKRWLAHDVLPQIRKTGAYAGDGEPAAAERIDLVKDAPLAARVDAVRVARTLFGVDRARGLWTQLGLPAVPDAPMMERGGEAAWVARLLLNHELGGVAIRRLILDALDGVADAGAWLDRVGVKVAEDGEGFYISNTSNEVRTIFRGTPWESTWRIVMRRLPGATPGPRFSFGGQQTRTTWFPLLTLDDYAGTRH